VKRLGLAVSTVALLTVIVAPAPVAASVRGAVPRAQGASLDAPNGCSGARSGGKWGMALGRGATEGATKAQITITNGFLICPATPFTLTDNKGVFAAIQWNNNSTTPGGSNFLSLGIAVCITFPQLPICKDNPEPHAYWQVNGCGNASAITGDLGIVARNATYDFQIRRTSTQVELLENNVIVKTMPLSEPRITCWIGAAGGEHWWASRFDGEESFGTSATGHATWRVMQWKDGSGVWHALNYSACILSPDTGQNHSTCSMSGSSMDVWSNH
jgi:hypothetical protein